MIKAPPASPAAVRVSGPAFADGSGVLSRAVIEGLFGLHPDALAGDLFIAPGFPAEWNQARLKWPLLNGAAEQPAAPKNTPAALPDWMSYSFWQLCEVGVALTWPVALVGLIGILLLVIFRSR